MKKFMIGVGVSFMVFGLNAKEFKVGFPNLITSLDSHIVNTAGEHILLEHLLRSLIAYNDHGNLVGDVAESWTNSPDFRSYTFILKDNLKFSDGSPIIADNVKKSWERVLNAPETVHYDFNNISEIEVSSKLKLVVKLKEEDHFFLHKLIHPEFGILSPHDAQAKTHKQNFKVTSGFYSLDSSTSNALRLKRNHFIEDNQLKYDHIVFKNTSKGPVEEFLDGKFDLVWNPLSNTSISTEKIKSLGYNIKAPLLNFSFWLSINPNLTETKDLSTRREIQKLLSFPNIAHDKAPVLTEAKQVFFNNVQGRLSDSEIEIIERKIKENKANLKGLKLKLLTSKGFLFSEEIVKRLKDQGVDVLLTHYDDFSKYKELIQNNDFHLVQVNNDFCLSDVSSALAVTFNESRPMIFPAKEQSFLKDSIKLLSHVKTLNERKEISHKIAHEIMENALVVPLYYYHSIIFYKNGVSLDRWSESYLDVSTWKIQVR